MPGSDVSSSSSSLGLASEVTELLQGLIRNACVNDGTPESGQEVRNAELLADYLAGCGLEFQRFEPRSGRVSLLARLPGIDPQAPTLLLMGHTDVVPANPADWEHDPFGGELIDGVVRGRGAVDMLSTTAAMAVALRHLALRGRPLRGTLLYLAVADEEALGSLGAKWIVEHEPDPVRADYVVTESGGFRLPLPSTEPGPLLPVMVGEKGVHWLRLTVRGRAGHGSTPYGTDNATIKVADVVRRIVETVPRAELGEAWMGLVTDAHLPTDLAASLRDPAALERFLPTAGPGLAGFLHALTHTTVTPTVVRSGVKTNIVPDRAELDLDVRTLPGETSEGVVARLRDVLGELSAGIEIETLKEDLATQSAIDSPLYESIRGVTRRLVPDARLVPMLMVGATDARFFRHVGATAYGAGLFSERIGFADFGRMFHGTNERIDQESLRLSTEFWSGLAADLLA